MKKLVMLGIGLTAYVKCVIEVNKEEKNEFNKKKQIVDKFKQDYYERMNI